MKFEVEIGGDSDGFISFECPYCKSKFKLNVNEYTDDENENIFCPYCGLEKVKSEFYASEVIEQATSIAQNYMFEKINKTFGKMSKNLNRNSILKMKFEPLKKVDIKKIRTDDTVEEQFECGICKKHVKVLYCIGKSNVFCSYCGENI